jgi:three-Cys-motif partner protein
LQAAAYKTLQGRSQTFNFVDAFAGPWKVSDDAKYSDASFDQAITTLEEVRAHLGRMGVGGLKIRFCFCERKPESAARLRDYAATKNAFEIHVFEGAFEDNLDQISAKLPDGFTFTFIDPTGWNIQNEKVFQFLRERNGEFLLNFMSDHINRHARYEDVSASFGRFLANPAWADDFNQLPDGWTNERKMLHLMKAAMKENDVAKFLPDFAIMAPRKEHIKMRLILGTHKAKGLEVFRDIQEKVEKLALEIKHNLLEGDDQQIGLFSARYIAELQQDQSGVGCKANKLNAESVMLQVLKSNANSTAITLFNQAMENVAIRRPQLNRLLLDMRIRNVVNFDLPINRRVPQDETIVSLRF